MVELKDNLNYYQAKNVNVLFIIVTWLNCTLLKRIMKEVCIFLKVAHLRCKVLNYQMNCLNLEIVYRKSIASQF